MAALYDSLNAMFTQIATDVKALFSGKVNKSGDTLTGNLVVNTPVESQVSVAATGKPDTQLYANANTCGLYALDAGFFTHYDRVANKKYVWGVDFGTVVLNNAGTYGINITGNADTVDGYHAANLMRKDEITFSTGANGCYVFPPDVYGNKLILQWGYNSLLSLGNRTIIFPTVFLHTCFGVQNTIINNNASGNDNNDTVSSVNQYGFTARSDGPGGSYWFALGY